MEPQLQSRAHEQLIRRLRRLERSHRRLRWLGSACALPLALLAAALLMGQATPPTQRTAQAYFLADKAGNRRAELSLTSAGLPQLLLFDKGRRVRLKLDLQGTAGQPSIVFYDASNKGRVMLGTRADGSPAMVFYDRRSKPRATMLMRRDGSAVLFFSDARGKVKKLLPSP